ncbi:hypothetical protein, partial [Falsigemmobacter faecalis]|uniref:hypothetical protein n=1 Tax=Falsigemmobacter faecalis TaxID=2488730 RepID=UPI001F2A6E42
AERKWSCTQDYFSTLVGISLSLQNGAYVSGRKGGQFTASDTDRLMAHPDPAPGQKVLGGAQAEPQRKYEQKAQPITVRGNDTLQAEGHGKISPVETTRFDRRWQT